MASITVKTQPHGTINVDIDFEVIDRGSSYTSNRFDWRAWFTNAYGDDIYIESPEYSETAEAALANLREHFGIEEAVTG